MRAATARRVEEPIAPQHDARTRRATAAVPIDLILADHRAGLFCRQLAAKYGYRSGNSISRLLKRHGEQPAPPGWARAVVPISHAAASRAYRLRQQPPLVIPARTPTERQCRRFTSLELEAIQQAIAAGRVQYVRPACSACAGAGPISRTSQP